MTRRRTRCPVPVPVPGAPDVSGLVNQPDALHSQFSKPCPGEESPKAGADDGDVDLVGQRVARKMRITPRIVGKSSKLACDFDVLRNAVRTYSPVPFKGIFLPQRIYVECHAASSTRLQLRSSPGILNDRRESCKDRGDGSLAKLSSPLLDRPDRDRPTMFTVLRPNTPSM
jgi:hypothetical protein